MADATCPSLRQHYQNYKEMTFITILIIVVFVVGYALIALESATHINKAAVALLMCVACWTLYMVHPADYLPGVTTDLLSSRINTIIEEHLGSISTTLFFLMGAMTIVEVVDQYGGFNFVRDTLKTQSKRGLLWRVVALTFILSAILDNMTTTIVMIMVLRKLVRDHSDRIIYASLIILAANAGGAFSPIGDVTTIMLWNVGSITAAGVIEELLIPSAISIFIPTLILQYKLHGALVEPDASTEETAASVLSGWQHKAVFVLGVGGLIFVPIFRYLTDLPPFVGILLVLAVLWTVTELFFRLSKRAKTAGDMGKRVSQLLGRVDMSTILFFLGILMTVACLEEVGVLTVVGQGLDHTFHGNHYLVTGFIGVLSSIVDNVPLVAGCIGMYPLQEAGAFAIDGVFWQLLAYCAGVGGSILIIGSAAGVVAMGLEKISFGWYARHISWAALIGYLAGIVSYYLLRTFVF